MAGRLNYLWLAILFLRLPIIVNPAFSQSIEAFLVGQQLTGDQTTISGTPLKVPDNTAGGFGAAFNVGRLSMNMDFLFSTALITMEEAELDVKMTYVNINFDWSFLRTAVSPVMSAGIGSVNFTDSFTQVENLNESDFSYNVAGGVRAVIREKYLLKAMYRTTWTKIQNTDDSIMFNGPLLELGYIF